MYTLEWEEDCITVTMFSSNKYKLQFLLWEANLTVHMELIGWWGGLLGCGRCCLELIRMEDCAVVFRASALNIELFVFPTFPTEGWKSCLVE